MTLKSFTGGWVRMGYSATSGPSGARFADIPAGLAGSGKPGSTGAGSVW